MKHSQYYYVFSLIVIVGLFIATGLAGIDFGDHWDEHDWQVKPVLIMVETQALLPQRYVYPSANYWINVAATFPEAWSVWREKRAVGGGQELARRLNGKPYLLRLRGIYVIITSFTIIWTYLIVLGLRHSPAEALTAAALLGFSWEVAYHARWVAQDALMMQCATLTILLALLARNHPERAHWLRLAAIAAGCTCGLKYPGGLVTIPVLMVAYQTRERGAPGTTVVARLLRVALIAGAAYLVTTPGTLIHPAVFLRDFLSNWSHYSAQGHWGNTVRPGLDHALAMFSYFAFAFFSRFEPIALFLFFFGVVGICVSLWQEPLGPNALLLTFPALYLSLFAQQRTMIVRNLLVVGPILAIYAARGLFLAREKLRAKPLQWGLGAVLVVVLAINAAWLVHAASTIRQRVPADRFIQEAGRYIDAHPSVHFFLSPAVEAALKTSGIRLGANVVTTPARADEVLFGAREAFHRWQDWPSNDRRLIIRWFGPADVNFPYYTSWFGRDRIVLMSRARALAIGVEPVVAALKKE